MEEHLQSEKQRLIAMFFVHLQRIRAADPIRYSVPWFLITSAPIRANCSRSLYSVGMSLENPYGSNIICEYEWRVRKNAIRFRIEYTTSVSDFTSGSE